MYIIIIAYLIKLSYRRIKYNKVVEQSIILNIIKSKTVVDDKFENNYFNGFSYERLFVLPSNLPNEFQIHATIGCDPSYPDICLPTSPDVNCGDISDKRFQVLPPDPHGLDTDGDGIGCES